MGRFTPRLLAPPLLVLFLTAGHPLDAQDTTTEFRDWLGVSVGGLWYESPDEQCTAGKGLSVGVEARTRGPWLLAGGADLLLGGVGTCTLRLEVAEWEGQRVEVDRNPSINFAPRATLRAGRAFSIGSATVTPGVGVGLLYLRPDFRTGDGAFWSTWYGAFVRLEAPLLPLSLSVESGSLELPIRYYGGEDALQVVHEFSHRYPLFRLTVVF